MGKSRFGLKICLATLAFFLLPGCATLAYYAQSVDGHFDLMDRAKPVNAVLEDEQLAPDIRRKLLLSQEARDFAIEELGLPDNDSYRTYADLARPFAVWNVVAAPEFSVEPRVECFLFAGCLSYRGYFSGEQAQAYAERLRSRGFDVYVGGAQAYSTLGWFNDPLLNTFLELDDARMLEVMFHELAHQKLYVKDDASFNEAYATAVAWVGVLRWFKAKENEEAYEAYGTSVQRREDLSRLLAATREELRILYQSGLPEEQMRQRKRSILSGIRDKYKALKEQWGGYGGYDEWMSRPLNNADLALVATYEDLVQAFLGLLERHNNDLAAFHEAVAVLGHLPADQRHIRLQEEGGTGIFAKPDTHSDGAGAAPKP